MVPIYAWIAQSNTGRERGCLILCSSPAPHENSYPDLASQLHHRIEGKAGAYKFNLGPGGCAHLTVDGDGGLVFGLLSKVEGRKTSSPSLTELDCDRSAFDFLREVKLRFAAVFGPEQSPVSPPASTPNDRAQIRGREFARISLMKTFGSRLAELLAAEAEQNAMESIDLEHTASVGRRGAEPPISSYNNASSASSSPAGPRVRTSSFTSSSAASDSSLLPHPPHTPEPFAVRRPPQLHGEIEEVVESDVSSSSRVNASAEPSLPASSSAGSGLSGRISSAQYSAPRFAAARSAASKLKASGSGGHGGSRSQGIMQESAADIELGLRGARVGVDDSKTLAGASAAASTSTGSRSPTSKRNAATALARSVLERNAAALTSVAYASNSTGWQPPIQQLPAPSPAAIEATSDIVASKQHLPLPTIPYQWDRDPAFWVGIVALLAVLLLTPMILMIACGGLRCSNP